MKNLIIGFILTAIFVQVTTCPVFAQPLTATDSAGIITATGSAIPQDRPDSEAIIGKGGIDSDKWQSDPEVTFTGKLAARSEDVLNWLLNNYKWAVLGPQTPFDVLWIFVRNTVFAILGLFLLAGAFLMIITRGRSLTVKRLIVRFVMVLILVIFSFSIVRTIYSLTDIVQGFFLVRDGVIITTKDLLNVAFGYKEFVGYRRIGAEYNESAITSLLLIKATAATYYTMFVILIIRKVVLWFFILVSPIFPLLLFFRPIRNTGKIWIGEFFRWVLYAPLFAIFLRGVVEVWKFGVDPTKAPNATGVPLSFNTQLAGTLTSTPPEGLVYPTAINILLGGPGQIVLGNNNINFSDTFVLYLVALLMLWMVIILPWILLRIFLDYFNNFSVGDSNLAKFITRNGLPPPGRYRPEVYPPPGSPTPPQTPPPAITGFAKSLPLSKFRHTPVAEIQQTMQEEAERQRSLGQSALEQASRGAQTVSLNTQTANISAGQLIANMSDAQSQQIIEALGLAGLTIPTMQDIAKYEAASLQRGGPAREELNKLSEALSRVAGTSQLVSPAERDKFSAIKMRLVSESNKGNALAKSVVDAASPVVTGAALPETNRVQQVNLEDYEEVRNTWQENYRKLEPPAGPDGRPKTRVEWLKEEVKQIPTVIDLLLSGDPKRQEQGKQMVSKILPFLLLGGFSNTEIVAYLKAKLEAAKAVLREVLQVQGAQEEEETKVEVNRPASEHAQKTMSAEAEIPVEETPIISPAVSPQASPSANPQQDPETKPGS